MSQAKIKNIKEKGQGISSSKITSILKVNKLRPPLSMSSSLYIPNGVITSASSGTGVKIWSNYNRKKKGERE